MSAPVHVPPPGLPRVARYSGIAEQVVDALARLNPLSVLRGPRGFGKTSALVTWLRREDELPETLYLTLTPQAGDRGGFWACLRHGLTHVDPRLGANPASQSDHERAVKTWLSRRQKPLLLIIDDYHEAGLREGAAGIDDGLVDLLSQNDQLYLVVAGRTMRALETIGSLSVETLVIGPEELQLTAPMVQDLATAMGLELTAERSQKVAVDLGGWPSAIRAGLQRAVAGHAYGVGEVSLADDYIAAMVQDLRFENVRNFLMRTAIPEEIDIETARVIAPEGNTVRMLRNVRSAGLLRESGTNPGTYYYPRAIRLALQGVLHETQPEAEQQVYEGLMRFAIRNNDAAAALTAAMKGNLWGFALDLVNSEWTHLLNRSPATLGQAASKFPASMIAENARLRVAAGYLQDLRLPGEPPIWAGVDSASLNAAIAAHRGKIAPTDQDELLLLLQWGAGSLLRGNLDMAIYAFSQARASALLDEAEPAAYLGAAGIALVHALQGEVDLGQDWLQEEGLARWLDQNEADGASDAMVLVASAARALVLTDGADQAAHAAVAKVIEPAYRDELWALCVFVRAHHAIAAGTTAEVMRQTSVVRTALRLIRAGSLLEALLTIVLVDALLASDMVSVAAEVVQRLEPRGFTWVAVARLRLQQGRFDEAIEAAQATLRSSDASGRFVLPAHAVLAAAHAGAGRPLQAREAFQAAVDQARQTGQRRGIELMGWNLFCTHAATDETVLRLWPGAAEPVGASMDALPEAVTLTGREAEILQCLTQYNGPIGIAQNLGVSVNTVKTHLRAVYRKLGVNNRKEALTKVQHVVVQT